MDERGSVVPEARHKGRQIELADHVQGMLTHLPICRIDARAITHFHVAVNKRSELLMAVYAVTWYLVELIAINMCTVH